MLISELEKELKSAKIFVKRSGKDLEIKNLTFDTNDIKNEALFFCIKGEKFDGHDFIQEAIKRGANSFVVEKEIESFSATQIIVNDTKEALSIAAEKWYDSPSKKLPIIGITGTNGKTTVAWFINNLICSLEKKTCGASIGTLGIWEGQNLIHSLNLTTPPAKILSSYFDEALKKQIKLCAIEVSSHALTQKRAAAISFDGAIFTNLTRDHLDYHKNFNDYKDAKKILFRMIEANGKGAKFGVVNLDDESGDEFVKITKNCLTFSRSKKTTLNVNLVSSAQNGAVYKFSYDGKIRELETSFLGEHNGQNLAAVILSFVALGYDFDTILNAIKTLAQVPGRLQLITSGGKRTYVDYAHTPDALERAIKALKTLPHKNLWVIFGCGGDRDKGKRPIMAKIAADFADKIVVTSDNPSTEDPQKILEDILSEGVKATIVEVDRKKAIEEAVKLASNQDIILVAGKGHEDYQIIGHERIHFSDVKILEGII